MRVWARCETVERYGTEGPLPAGGTAAWAVVPALTGAAPIRVVRANVAEPDGCCHAGPRLAKQRGLLAAPVRRWTLTADTWTGGRLRFGLRSALRGLQQRGQGRADAPCALLLCVAVVLRSPEPWPSVFPDYMPGPALIAGAADEPVALPRLSAAGLPAFNCGLQSSSSMNYWSHRYPHPAR